jgi:hypothetical protein
MPDVLRNDLRTYVYDIFLKFRKSCKENRKEHFVPNRLFLLCAFYETITKNTAASHWPRMIEHNMAQRRLDLHSG